jgi:hypothetical protein
MAWRIKDAVDVLSTFTASIAAVAKKLTLTGTAGEGYVEYIHQSSDAGTPGVGSDNVRLFAKAKQLYTTVDDDAGNPVVQEIGGGGGSGQGELNYIDNPSGASDTDGWTESTDGKMDISRTATAAELPRENLTGTGLKIVGTSAAAGEYVASDFDLDDADKSKLMKLQFDLKPVSGYAAGDFEAVIYDIDNTAEITPVTTSIPNAEGRFSTAWVSTTSSNYELRIKGKSGLTTSAGIVISNVIVGPGDIVQGAAIENRKDVSSDISISGFGSGSSIDSAWMERRGSTMVLTGRILLGSSGYGTFLVILPSDMTIDDSVSSDSYGYAFAQDLTGGITIGAARKNASDQFAFLGTPSNDDLWDGTAGKPFGGAANDRVDFYIEAPIAEWAGEGTVNLGAGRVEYAYNSGTWDATDTTSFAYGPGGGTTGGALTANRDKRVRFSTAIQPTDFIDVQMSDDQITWLSLPANVGQDVDMLHEQNGVYYGAFYKRVSGSNTDVDVTFGQYAHSSGATFGAAGSAWTSGKYWRAVKYSAGLPVAFGIARDGNAGLIESYRETTTTMALTGSGLSFTFNIRLQRVNNVVTLTFDQESGTGNNTQAYIEGAGVIASDYRPNGTVILPIVVGQDTGGAGGIQTGRLQVESNGNVRMYPEVAGSANWNGSCVVYRASATWDKSL